MIAIDIDKLRAIEEARAELSLVLARAVCKNISRKELHGLLDAICDEWGV